MAAAVARSGSRSPRGKRLEEAWPGEEEAPPDPDDPDALGPDGLPQSFKGGFSEQMKTQRDFLAQFMRHSPGKKEQTSAPKEAAAGLPVDAAQFLLLSPGPGPATPWMGLPSHVACLAATLRLFARLLPGRVSETACDELCSNFKADLQLGSDSEQLLEMVGSWGFEAKPVISALEPMQAMVKGRPTACCVFFDAYVGVLEDPETHQESEQEVGSHCAMIVGGDLLGPNYVVFDPWGPAGGEVTTWPDHVLKTSSAVAFVQLSPGAPATSVSSAGYTS